MTASISQTGPAIIRLNFLPGLVSLPNSLEIGTVITGAVGSQASATVSGAAPTQTLNLTIPKGDQGIQGNASTVPGPANTLAIGTVTTGNSGTAASATITGTAPNQTLNLTIPRGTNGTGAVNSVAGRAGDVVLTAADVSGALTAPVANGSLANAAAGTVKANLTGGAAAPSDVSLSALLAALGLGPFAFGQCRLVLTSSSTLTLVPRNGNQVFVAGAFRTIPSGGVPFTNTNLTAGLTFYAYLSWSGTALVGEFSTTTHATDATTGLEVKSGDNTRTLVGMVYMGPGTPGTFVDTSSQRFVASWFNRLPRPLKGIASGSSTASSAPVALSTGQRVSWVGWADEVADLNIMGNVYGSGVGVSTGTQIYLDGSPAGVGSQMTSASNGSGSVTNCPAVDTAMLACSEGYHYADAYGFASGGSGVWSTNIVGALVQ